MGQRIRVRRDAALTWTNNNQILEAGEFGLESDTRRLKIGDGILNWVGLAYYNSSKVGSGILNGTIAISTSLTATHLLGQVPDFVIGYMECVTANNGYAVGDRIYSNQGKGIDYSSNSTNVTISFNNVLPSIVPKAGGAMVVIVAANWKAIARPMRIL